MDRDILHFHVPGFAVAVARSADPSLRGRPVAIAPATPRAVVLGLSSEALAAGIRRGISVEQARRRCPGLRVVDPAPERTSRAQTALVEIVRQYTPLWEPLRPGHLYLDLTGGRRLFGPARDVGARVEREASKHLDLVGNVGVGANKLVSRVASQFIGNGGVCEVVRGGESAFLAPLPLDLLPGLGVRDRDLLNDWNVRRIGEILQIPTAHLEAVFGAFGRMLPARALGEDWEPVHPPAGEPRVVEGEVLEKDTADSSFLLLRLRRLVASGCAKLRAEERTVGRVEVGVRHTDGREARRSARLVPPTFWDHEIFPKTRKLLLAASERRTRVRRLEVRFSRFSAAPMQLNLFLPLEGDPRRETLARCLDGIWRKHGFEAVMWGGCASPRDS